MSSNAMPSPGSNAAASARPSRIELACLAAVLGALLCFNLATYNEYPEVWTDEVWWSEPAVNWVTNGSFTTSVWQGQPANTFPTINCPLYMLALAPWLSLFGTSVLAIRSFNYVLLGIA